MQLADAKQRHRELTQAVYDIGDDVAEHVDHIVEAMRDWDVYLVRDCLLEFNDCLEEAMTDARRTIGLLAGLRLALTTGRFAGSIDAPEIHNPTVSEPELVDAHSLSSWYPLEDGLQDVTAMTRAISGRHEEALTQCEHITDWILDQTAFVACNLTAINMPRMLSTAGRYVDAIAKAWILKVGECEPAYTKVMHGSNPPKFLEERIRVENILTRVRQRRNAGGAQA
ncbi:MAG: hypothetical protein Q3972_01595 [Corynebacterium sp.]|nr:hypothetical protein [Corynebacterium sp.]